MDPVHTLQANQTGVLLIGVHFLTLEIGARMFGMQAPGIGVYRPNDNPVIDLIQTNGRMWLVIDPMDGSTKIKRVNEFCERRRKKVKKAYRLQKNQ